MRLAWFSPLPPSGSGIAAYSAELLPELEGEFAIDRYPHAAAHDFVWRHRHDPYDLTVYQLGNAPWHDYMWAYAANYPGLVILHDARLHHARARQLLKHERIDDYRRELAYDHPDAPPALAEYAVNGLGGPIYYLWRMIAALARTARGVAVHNERVAADLRAELPGVRVDTIRMGVPAAIAEPASAADMRRQLNIPADALVFAAFGKMTAEKRVGAVLSALASSAREGAKVHLLLIGDTSAYPTLASDLSAAGLSERVTIAGEVADADLPRHLAVADVCLCLRWPTAEETSASWLRCLAAARATVISDLPHLVDVPTLLASSGRRSHAGTRPVAVAIDLLDEAGSLRTAIDRLASDAALRAEIASAGHAYWRAHHRLELMADDYRALVRAVAKRPVPVVHGLPPHFTDDCSSRAREIAATFGVDVDILR